MSISLGLPRLMALLLGNPFSLLNSITPWRYQTLLQKADQLISDLYLVPLLASPSLRAHCARAPTTHRNTKVHWR